ncbi:MAG: hypothetical protein RQ833_05770 [Sphingomonadaceae bacterium]|nr:hypothetical protein [Sphingomonadaceae bacterium]
MNAWPFIAAAYGIGVTGIAGLVIYSYGSMRAAERVAALLKERKRDR